MINLILLIVKYSKITNYLYRIIIIIFYITTIQQIKFRKQKKPYCQSKVSKYFMSCQLTNQIIILFFMIIVIIA
jgi:L-asparagine transporter-like permease